MDDVAAIVILEEIRLFADRCLLRLGQTEFRAKESGNSERFVDEDFVDSSATHERVKILETQPLSSCSTEAAPIVPCFRTCDSTEETVLQASIPDAAL